MAESCCTVHKRWEIVSLSRNSDKVLGRCEDCGFERWLGAASWYRRVPHSQKQYAQPSSDSPDAGRHQSLRGATAMPTATDETI